MDENNIIFTKEELDEANTKMILKEVASSLEEKGYNPITQLGGYILSGDKTYISTHEDARKKIDTLDRTKIIEYILKEYLK